MPAAYTLDVADVVELEGRIARDGTPLYDLMQRAGAALAQAVEERHAQPCEVVVLAGSGNNGGDGWVAAELLAARGHRATLVTPRPAQALTAEPARTAALHAAAADPAPRILVDPAAGELHDLLAGADAAIDAMLGTGFSHDTLREPYATWTSELNAAHAAGLHVIAADVPSGVSAQTGAGAEPHVAADETVTMMVLKPGVAGAACGRVAVADIHDLAPYRDFLEERAVSGPTRPPTPDR